MSDDWYHETYGNRTRFGVRLTERLFDGQSDFQRVEVFETAFFGRALALDGYFMTSEGDEFLYHEMLVHVPLMMAPAVQDVLVIGGGDGGTVREVLRYPGVRRVTMVEIDPLVIEVSKRYLAKIGTAWDDPRLEVRVGDGIRFVRDAADGAFDVVLLDGTDPVGPAEGLFNESFYRDVKRVLRPEGVFALQSESPIIMREVFTDTQRTLKRVFDTTQPYFGPVPLYASALWSWTLAGASGLAVREPRMERYPAISATCRAYTPEVHRAAMVVPPYVAQMIRSPGR